ncbi:MAG: hypothetical protein E7011_05165 [Alphaproteobacteria bacterium]|nr:hypothetical protein [Alphaproteobacteria bacterium]
MKKTWLILMIFVCGSAADAAPVGRVGRNVIDAGAYSAKVYRSATDSFKPIQGTNVIQAIKTSEISNTNTVHTPHENASTEPTIDPEMERIKWLRNVCMSNNIGLGNTFVWAAKDSPTDNYAYMIEDANNQKNNTCFVKVDLNTSDSRIDLGDIQGKYFEMGQPLVCGSWIDEKMLEKRILDGKKKARNWGVAASVVGGAGVGVAAMELFGNKLIGGKVQGQKALDGQDILVSQIKVLKKDKPNEYERVMNALESLEENCSNDKLWSDNKPTDCDAETNPFIGLLEKVK